MKNSTGAVPSRAQIRADFEQSLSFNLDDFQREAMDSLDAGSSVVVAAPTGSGKTVIAEYAIAVALASGQRAYYTAPIKALSNQKFKDLVDRHGAANVGLLTGDTSVNESAPIVVMTTEVLRNMIHSSGPRLGDLRYVIMDEVHFLQDTYRGPVWEEVIISTPPEVDLVCLSATVSNARDLADWVSSVRGTTHAIVHTERPVELTQLFLVGHRGNGDVDVYETFQDGKPNAKMVRLDAESSSRRAMPGRGRDRDRGNVATPRRIDIVEMLQFEDLLPAIYFIFSRAACDEAMRNCLHAGVRLTHPTERAEIRAIVEAKVSGLSDSDLDALDYANFAAALENGIAAHHAGMVPPFKEAVEACFTEGLVKVVFATETLALGINMPARTVVIEKLTKFNGSSNQMLTAGEFTQLTGRAGRRGLDPHGYAVTLWSPHMAFEEVAELASRRTYELRSAFRPTYNLAANLIRRSSREQAHHFLKLSFAQYQVDAHLVRAHAASERIKRELETARAQMVCDRGDIQAYRSGESANRRTVSGNRSERRAAQARNAQDTWEPTDRAGRGPVDASAIAQALNGAQPGAILRYLPLDAETDEKHGVVVMSTSTRGAERVMLRALTISGAVVSVTADSITSVPEVVGFAQVPVPFNPQSRHFQKQLTENLNKALGNGGRRSGGRYRAPVEVTDAIIEPVSVEGVAGCPDLKQHLSAAAAIDRLEAELRRNMKVSAQRGSSLVDQFDRVLALLDDMKCTDGWSLTDSGRTLAGVFHECDLLIADCVRAGLFDGLNPPQIAALCSVFVHERRGPDRGGRDDLPRSFPKSIVDRWWRIADRAEALNQRESAVELPLTRLPDPGFAAIAHGWATGRNLHAVMATEEITGGDLVRTMKAVIDLLRQLGEVAPLAETREVAKTAAKQLFRGVVSVSSTITPSPSNEPSLIPIFGELISGELIADEQ
jgi:ATP-dependent RNA helicase HelY